MAAFDGSGGEAVKQRSMAIALLAAVLVMATLLGCAPPAAKNPGPTPAQRPAVELATTTPLSADRITAT